MRTVFFILLAVGYAVSVGIEAPLYFERVTSIYKYERDIFVMPVLVGNPKRAFNLTLDIDYYRTGLIGTDSLTPACSKDGSHKGFNPARSTTFRNANTRIEWVPLANYMKGNQCEIVLGAEAIVGRDDFLGVKNVPFRVITNFTGGWNAQWPSDGFLGLDAPNEFNPPNAVKALAKNTGGEAIVAFYLNRARVTFAEVGSIAFGRVPDACGDVKYAPEEWNYVGAPWNIRVDKASLGNTTSRGETLGQLDISSSILADLDGRVLADFMQEIGAEANEDVGRYFVDCKRAAGLPNLTITTGDVELSFSSKDYVDLASDNDGKCIVLLTSLLGDSWSFGNRLFERYCVVLNYETGAVGFAEIQ
ncbi:aspartyl proteinase [Aphelenchoides avenae]|nr:aspartyl proteinase [Aphelenchus avenae]